MNEAERVLAVSAKKKMSALDRWIDEMDLSDEKMLKLDGFDDACIGVAEIFEPCPGGAGATHNHRLMYDRDKIIAILMDRDSMTDEEAEEYFEFNIVDAYVGVNQPGYVTAYQSARMRKWMVVSELDDNDVFEVEAATAHDAALEALHELHHGIMARPEPEEDGQ